MSSRTLTFVGFAVIVGVAIVWEILAILRPGG